MKTLRDDRSRTTHDTAPSQPPAGESDDPDPHQPAPTPNLARRFWYFLGRHRPLIVTAAFGSLLTVTLAMLAPLITKLIIDEALPSQNLPLLIGLAVGFLLLQGLRLAIGYGNDFLMIYVGQRTVFDIRRALFHHLQLLHLSFYEKERTASLVNRVIHDAATIQQFVNTAFSTLANNLVSLAIGLSIMFFLNWKLTLFCVLVLPLYFLIIHAFRRQIHSKNHEVKERQSRLAGNLGEVFAGIRVVKSFAQEDHERRRFVLNIKENFHSELELPLLGSRMRISLNLLSITVCAIVWVWGGLSVFNGTMTIGGYVAYLSYLTMLFAPVESLSTLLLAWTNARTGFERILTLLDIKPKISEPPRPVELPEIEGRVVFDHVHFSFDGKPAITDFNLDVAPGEVIALVGHSGCGKSTLMSLLTRFYDVESGSISVDGIDLRQLNYTAYRQQVGIVLQENYLFSGTVEENIRYGRPDATDEEVREAAHLANALEFIEKIPGGFQGQIGQAGVTLSGGQRQRLAIARTILKNPRILIFDEATSALDNHSEKLIQASLDTLMKGKTVFIVAHRLSTIVKASRIVMMSAGQILEIGTHQELLAKKGAYSRLYQPTSVPALSAR
ncbi:MAG TPA: ABC transporter ATP-binding protein [Chthoniobacteraceae bacterium]|nr:ABC transporter ATP-binding protein [Chthoniobacteraceae bacterium]